MSIRRQLRLAQSIPARWGMARANVTSENGNRGRQRPAPEAIVRQTASETIFVQVRTRGFLDGARLIADHFSANEEGSQPNKPTSILRKAKPARNVVTGPE